MSGFGERLERERLNRGVKLEDIAAATKIGTRMLRALETEKFDRLPGGIFNRGFVRAYARHLGLDEDQCVTEYLAAAGELESPELPVPSHKPEEAARWLRLGALFAVTLVAVVSAWHYRHALYSVWHGARAQPDMRRVSAAEARSQTPPPENSGPAAASPAAASPAPSGGTRPGSTAAPLENAPKPGTEPGQKPMAGVTSVTLPRVAAAVPAVDQFIVTIKVNEPSWLAVTADDQSLMQGILAPSDQRRQFRASRKLILSIGNAGGVEVSFNGVPVGPLGAENIHKEVTFTPTGLQRPNQN
ncbi:MAG: DUF4115 domain-containing protein [Acidobacteria bacterium]|nr:DUF4115 domain-containing protein [Acidobacteriota bacterium]